MLQLAVGFLLSTPVLRLVKVLYCQVYILGKEVGSLQPALKLLQLAKHIQVRRCQGLQLGVMSLEGAVLG